MRGLLIHPFEEVMTAATCCAFFIINLQLHVAPIRYTAATAIFNISYHILQIMDFLLETHRNQQELALENKFLGFIETIDFIANINISIN